MITNITLSKKEKKHYFLYLLGMLLLAVLILSLTVLNRTVNPFSDADMHSVMILQEKSRFDEAQKAVQKQMDSVFADLNKFDPEKSTPVEENNIEVGISNINNAFKMSGAKDPRKESYQQIAKFYKMYFEDKKNTVIISKNVENFKKQYEDCTVGYKARQEQMMQR